AQAASLLRENEVVAFPTETVYGLGGNAHSDKAIQKIYEAKGRPSDNPLIIHIADRDQLNEFVTHIPDKANKLMNEFWPGPLTIIFEKKSSKLSQLATAGLSTVAVRMPNHPVALAVIKEAGVPIAAPSANSSGKPSPTKASHVLEDLNGRIAGIVDGGATGVGVESTVIDCTEEIPIILRPGGVTRDELEQVVGAVQVDPALKDQNEAPKSPGMKYRHYAPKSPLFLVKGDRDKLQQLINKEKLEGRKVGVLTTTENEGFYQADEVILCGTRENLATVASSLYDVLRSFDQREVDIIFSEIFPSTGVGEAIMNRLMKAAGNQIIE
ncbi:MAG: L-threonylcarbamoyladenylate synthase, partial [Bacillus sp. (in: firmicutes)]